MSQGGPNSSGGGSGGDVVGPGSSTDNALARWNGTGGDALQDSTVIVTDNGEMTNASQPAFEANLGSTDVDVTGNGTVYTLGTNIALTEVFDQGGNFNTNGTFTAPISGRYFFSVTFDTGNPGIAGQGAYRIVTSNRTFLVSAFNPTDVQNAQAGAGVTFTPSRLCNMDAADTTTFTINFNSNGSNTTDLRTGTGVSGFLVV